MTVDVPLLRPQVSDLRYSLCCNKTTEETIGWWNKRPTRSSFCVCFRRVVHCDGAKRIILIKKHVAEVGAANADRILQYLGTR